MKNQLQMLKDIYFDIIKNRNTGGNREKAWGRFYAAVARNCAVPGGIVGRRR